jgi:chaperonin GroES
MNFDLSKHDLDADIFSEYVLILPDEKLQKTEGGILIPETAQQFPARGHVICVGSEVTGKKIPERGNYVLFQKGSGTITNILGNEYILIPAEKFIYA